jgi:hypothetical protein
MFHPAHDPDRRNCYPLFHMTTVYHTEYRRLTLQIERDLVLQSRFKILLTVANTTLADHRQALKSITAHIRRAERTHTA